jgi:2-oxoglutarate ferredoxin oxidoreductase subunit beta
VIKKIGENPFLPIDICQMGMNLGCGFVARSFAGDPKQAKELIKAGLSFEGTALLDIISPCVTFNNRDESTKSYTWGKEHEIPLHDVTLVPAREEIQVDYEPGTGSMVELHDGSMLMLRKLERDYDPTDRLAALRVLEEARSAQELITGLIYYNAEQPVLPQVLHQVQTPLAALPVSMLRPDATSLEALQADLR